MAITHLHLLQAEHVRPTTPGPGVTISVRRGPIASGVLGSLAISLRVRRPTTIIPASSVWLCVLGVAGCIRTTWLVVPVTRWRTRKATLFRTQT